MSLWSWEEIQEARKEFARDFKNFFVFDIETVKDNHMFNTIADEKEVERDQNGEFLSIPFHKVVSISYMIIKNSEVKEFRSIVSENEQILLQTFWKKFSEAHSFKTENRKRSISIFPVLITVNGKDFDIPVIKARTLKYVSAFEENQLIKKFISIFLDKFNRWEDGYPRYTNRYTLFHIDIPVDIFGRKISLKNLCYLCSIPVKQEGKGESVEDYYNDGELLKIAKYCAEDVKATAMLFSYINSHLLFNTYPFPDFDMIKQLEPEIEEK